MNKDERIIFCDLDGMFVNLYAKLVSLYNAEFGRNLICAEAYTAMHDDEKTVAAVIDDYLSKDGIFEDLEFLPGAEDALHELKNMGTVVIASAPSRNPDSAMHKIKWVQQRMGIPRGDIGLLKRKYLLRGSAWFEDWHHNIEQIRGAHPDVWIGSIAYPYNTHVSHHCSSYAEGHLDTKAAWDVLLRDLEEHFRRGG